jgi:hypothetical protein
VEDRQEPGYASLRQLFIDNICRLQPGLRPSHGGIVDLDCQGRTFDIVLSLEPGKRAELRFLRLPGSGGALAGLVSTASRQEKRAQSKQSQDSSHFR